MKQFRSLATLLLISFVLSACSPTVVSQSWKDEQFNAPLGKIMILGVSENDTARRVFEQEMAAKFKEQGINAVPSYQLLPDDEKLKKTQVVDAAKSNDVQSVFVTRVASIKKMKENRAYVSGTAYYGSNYQNSYYTNRHSYNRDWYDYYGRHYNDSYTVSSHTYEWKIITTDSTLYQLGNEKMVWSAVLKSESDQMESTIESLAKTLVKQMKKDGVL